MAGGRAAQDPGGRGNRVTGSLSGAEIQLPLHLVFRHLVRQGGAGETPGKDRADRGDRARPVRSPLGSCGQRLSGRGDPRQPDRGNAGRQAQAKAALHAGRRGGPPYHRGYRADVPDSPARTLVGLGRGVGGDGADHPPGRGLVVLLGPGAAACRVGPHDRDPVHGQHGLRVLRRGPLQAAIHRALWAVCPARAGGQDGRRPGAVYDGAAKCRAHHPVFRCPRLHRHFRGAEPRTPARVHQRVPDRHEQHHPGQVPGYARQVHRRRDHGLWNAPVEDETHPRNGILAAMEMLRQCDTLNQKFTARGWPTLKIGIGVNSGSVRVGDMGSKQRKAYTAMGDAVNVASRLEGRTKHYGVGILVGEASRKLVQDVVFKEIDKIKVKGKDEAITIYEPLGLEAEVEKKVLDELKLWHQTLRQYRALQWDQVEVSLLNLQRMNPDCYLYKLYANEVAAKRRNPPPANWDGVTAFDEK